MLADRTDRADDLKLVLDTAREAGQLALWWLEQGARAWAKSPGNPVTEADIAINELIHARLTGARPDYGWLSEESPAEQHRRDRPCVYVVDPIDGTRAFMEGKPGFCISIAQTIAGEAVLGALLNPVTCELFWASRGEGAWLNDEPIHCTASDTMSAARLISRPERLTRGLRERCPGIVSMQETPSSIAYRMALVAAGRWDGAVSSGPKADWDLAAAAVIVEEAGGLATDLAGERLRFNRDSISHDGLAAAGETLHPLLLETLRAVERPH